MLVWARSKCAEIGPLRQGLEGACGVEVYAAAAGHFARGRASVGMARDDGWRAFGVDGWSGGSFERCPQQLAVRGRMVVAGSPFARRAGNYQFAE